MSKSIQSQFKELPTYQLNLHNDFLKYIEMSPPSKLAFSYKLVHLPLSVLSGSDQSLADDGQNQSFRIFFGKRICL